MAGTFINGVEVSLEELRSAREKAAQAWCTPGTEDRVMDSELAEAFACILASELVKAKTG